LVGHRRLRCGSYVVNPRKYENYVNDVQELDEEERNELAHITGLCSGQQSDVGSPSKWELLFSSIQLSFEDFLPENEELETTLPQAELGEYIEVAELSQLFVDLDREILLELDSVSDPGPDQSQEPEPQPMSLQAEEEREKQQEEDRKPRWQKEEKQQQQPIEKLKEQEQSVEAEQLEEPEQKQAPEEDRRDQAPKQEEKSQQEQEDVVMMEDQQVSDFHPSDSAAETSLTNEGVDFLAMAPSRDPPPSLPTAKRWSLLLHPHYPSEESQQTDDPPTPTEVLFSPHKRLRRLLTGALLIPHTTKPNS
jgi:hypothetical protein